MAINTHYEPASGCRSAQSGVKAFMSWYLGAYRDKRNPAVANLGIYVCKRLGSGWSLHAEGRAADIGTKPYKRPGSWMWTLLNRLRLKSKELGVQLIIHEGKIWSANYPNDGWREYNGDDPHNGHAHVEFNWWAARSLTASKIEAILHGLDDGNDSHPKPQPPASNWTQELIMALPTLKKNARGTDVKRLQGLLQANRYTDSRIDGRFGPQTERALKRFQKNRKVKNSVVNGNGDGICGPHSWAALLGA